MKPGDHPEFFRLPPPEGRSRESTIRLDAEGRFWHDAAPVEHAGMARAFASWIARHPDDGRFILTNGFDWTYFQVDATPFFVVGVSADPAGAPRIALFDGSEEVLDPAALWVEAGVFHTRVKNGAFVARFTRQAQIALAEWLDEAENGSPVLKFGDRTYDIRGSVPGS